jgi:hypothetical protein
MLLCCKVCQAALCLQDQTHAQVATVYATPVAQEQVQVPLNRQASLDVTSVSPEFCKVVTVVAVCRAEALGLPRCPYQR